VIRSETRPPVFDFGGVAVALSSRNRRFMSLVRQRYGSFSTGQSPALRVEYRVNGLQPPHPDAIHAARQRPLEASRRGSCYTLDGGTFRGEWNQAAGEMEIRGPLATYPIDRLIEAMVYAVEDQVLILHAAALVFSGRGFVCSGPSGSGKSTLAALFPDEALCDEHVVVRLEGNGARLSSLPFWTGRPGTTTLEAIYLLEHASEHRRRRLSVSEAAVRLRPQVIWPAVGRDSFRRAFDTFCGVIEGVPVWELGFLPDTSVRRVMIGETGK
jgi:hypothetical protein